MKNQNYISKPPAAPDLLEALRELERVARGALDTSATYDGMRNCELLAKARAAIAKSEGVK